METYKVWIVLEVNFVYFILEKVEGTIMDPP